MVQMFINQRFRLKSLIENNTEPDQYNALRRKFSIALGFLLFGLFAALTIIGIFQGWGDGGNNVPMTSYPNWQKHVTNEVINVIRLLVIFCFVGAGTKIVLNYQEKVAKLKIAGTATQDKQGSTPEH
jgi:hypothetical protein